jgi:hypothetical protein
LAPLPLISALPLSSEIALRYGDTDIKEQKTGGGTLFNKFEMWQACLRKRWHTRRSVYSERISVSFLADALAA